MDDGEEIEPKLSDLHPGFALHHAPIKKPHNKRVEATRDKRCLIFILSFCPVRLTLGVGPKEMVELSIVPRNILIMGPTADRYTARQKNIKKERDSVRRLTLVTCLIITFMFLIACGVNHSEVLKRNAEIFSNSINEIKPSQNPVGGAALIIIQSDVEIQKVWIKAFSGSSVSQERLDFFTALSRNAYQFNVDAITKRCIFDSVSVARHNGNPASHPIGNSDFIIFVDVDGWFIKEKNKPLILPVTFDKYKLLQGIPRTEAFLDELNQQAQNLCAK
ncbi:MAG: hypothetical protein ABII88_02940 [Candidatus Omnitrophota bacterium]